MTGILIAMVVKNMQRHTSFATKQFFLFLIWPHIEAVIPPYLIHDQPVSYMKRSVNARKRLRGVSREEL